MLTKWTTWKTLSLKTCQENHFLLAIHTKETSSQQKEMQIKEKNSLKNYRLSKKSSSDIILLTDNFKPRKKSSQSAFTMYVMLNVFKKAASVVSKFKTWSSENCGSK